jgi:hypothetical protein
MQKQHRYNAACAASLAGIGQGNDAVKLDDKERTRLLKQAHDWLRADLVHWTKQTASDRPADRALAMQTLKHWQEDADLAGIRDKDAVTKLPEAEQVAFRKLWADVDEVLKRSKDGMK